MGKILVTSALPYANGPIHIGHIAGAYLPADIYVRFQKMSKNDVLYICGSDEHGVPITINAEKRGVSPKDIVDQYHKVIKNSFELLNIDFDNFSRTTTQYHHDISQKFFKELLENGFIEPNVEKQLYCEDSCRFLPDRYVEGICPHCGYDGARGDECPKCGKWLEAIELKSPRSELCKSELVIKETKHWYLKLDKLQGRLEEWVNSKDWKENVKNFVMGWFKEGLQERPITRDLNWGIPVPIDTEDAKGKVLYVWFDAPIGYISSTMEWAEKQGQPDKWKDYWMDQSTKLVHFIGKDNIPFHAIVWPAMVMGQNTKYILPSEVPANEHLTVENDKISTSKGNAVWIEEFLEDFPADYLRYYLAVNAPETKDSDFSWKNFQSVINVELINVVANLFNRVLTFSYSKFDKKVPNYDESIADDTDKNLLKLMDDTFEKAKKLYSQFKVRELCKEVIALGRAGNQYFQDREPWKLIKEDKPKAALTLNVCVRLIEALAVLYYPIIPQSSLKMWEALNLSQDILDIDINSFTIENPQGREILKPSPLFKKVEDKEVEKHLEILKKRIANQNTSKKETEAQENLITIDDFKKVSLKVGTVLKAEKVKKSKKLFKMKVSLGSEVRQIIGGLAEHYEAEQLIGKKVIVVANLKPAKLMGLESNGMILAAKDNETLTLLTVSDEVSDGSKIS